MKRPLLTWLLATAALVAFGGTALALTGPHVDPKAPCFRWPAVDYDGDGVFDRVDNCPNTPQGCQVDRFGCSIDEDGDGVCDGLDQCPNTEAGAKVDKQGCSEAQLAARSAPVARQAPPPVAPPPPPPPPREESETEKKIDTGHMRMENIYFESGSDHLLPESEPALDEVGKALEHNPNLRLEIQGHTDTRGPAAYNMKLSQKRAEAVRSYLISHFNVDGDRLVAKGYGETRPETKERNQEELLRNRRVELEVIH